MVVVCEEIISFQMIKEVQKTETGKKLTAAGEEALKQVCIVVYIE